MTEKEIQVAPARMWWVLPVAIIGVIFLLGLIGVAIDDNDTVSATSASSSSSTSTTVQFTTQTSAPLVTSTTTAETTTSTTATATTATTAACRNSTVASCGAFRWDPEPGANRPLSIEVRWPVEQPRAGDEVVFTATVADPDATPIKEGACGNSTGMTFGDGGSIPTSCGTPCTPTRYGPWTPPAAGAGSSTFQFRHTYGAAGTYTPTLVFASGDRCNPYSSVHHISFNITITN